MHSDGRVSLDPSPAKPVARVPDLHKSAFWIYGVTAMVMREPLAVVLHHANTAGWSDPGVHIEALRGLIVWMLLSRQFTVAGVYFDHVYLQPDSADRDPRRSYPLDFLIGVGALLAAVATSTLVSADNHLFNAVVGVALAWDVLWLLLAALMRHSSVSLIAPETIVSLVMLAIGGVTLSLFGEVAAYVAVLVCILVHLGRLMAAYDTLYAIPRT